MTQKLLYFIWFFLFSLFLCWMDCSLFFLFEKQYFHFLLPWLIMQFLFTESFLALIYLSFLSLVESFIIFGHAFYGLVYLMPIMIIAYFLRQKCYISSVYPFALALISMGLNIWILEGKLRGQTFPQTYTMGKITGIVISVGIFSLTTYFWGKIRQPLMETWEESPDS